MYPLLNQEECWSFWSISAMKLEELLEHVAAWSQEGRPPTQYLFSALGWRYRS